MFFECEADVNVRKRLFSGIAIAASLALTAGLSACSSGSDDEDAPLEDSYTYATDTSFVPFEFKKDGKYVGFDIDLITAVADEAGFELKQEVTNFDGIIPGLQTGSFDLAVAGISITDERKQTIDFSDPYYKSGLILGVPTDNDDIKSIDDLDGKIVGVQQGTTGEAYATENAPGAELLQLREQVGDTLPLRKLPALALLLQCPELFQRLVPLGLQVGVGRAQGRLAGLRLREGPGQLLALFALLLGGALDVVQDILAVKAAKSGGPKLLALLHRGSSLVNSK